MARDLPPVSEEAIEVHVTFPAENDARRIARDLVRDRLAAATQVAGPIHSVYRWRGALQTADEWLILIKTTVGRWVDIVDRIRSVHPYEEPEIIALPIVAGSPTYLAWIARSVAREAPETPGDR